MSLRIGQEDASGVREVRRREGLECLACPVRIVNFCSEIPDSEIENLWRSRQRVSVRKRDAIICERTSAQAYYNVISGVVKLSRSTRDGRTQIVGFKGPGSFFAIPQPSEDTLHVEGLTDAQLCRFSQSQFRQLIRRYASVQCRVLFDSLRQIEILENHALLLGRRTAKERVATFLLQRQRDQAGAAGGHRIDMPMTRAEIAEFLGLAPETVSRILATFKREGMITFGQTQFMWLLDVQLLARTACGSRP